MALVAPSNRLARKQSTGCSRSAPDSRRAWGLLLVEIRVALYREEHRISHTAIAVIKAQRSPVSQSVHRRLPLGRRPSTRTRPPSDPPTPAQATPLAGVASQPTTRRPYPTIAVPTQARRTSPWMWTRWGDDGWIPRYRSAAAWWGCGEMLRLAVLLIPVVPRDTCCALGAWVEAESFGSPKLEARNQCAPFPKRLLSASAGDAAEPSRPAFRLCARACVCGD